MAPKSKKVWKRDDSAKASRKARSKKENEKNAQANAKARIESAAEAKLEKERTLIPPPTILDGEVESSLLVKAMEGGFLEDVKIFRFIDYKFLVPVLLSSSNLYVSYIERGLERYVNSITNDEVEKSRAESVIQYFQDEDWESYNYERATQLLYLLQGNDYYYAKTLWENESLWKEEWKAKRFGKWQLLHPLRTKEMQERIKKRALEEDNNIEEEEPATTSKKSKKSKVKPTPTSKNKIRGKGKGKGKSKA